MTVNLVRIICSILRWRFHLRKLGRTPKPRIPHIGELPPAKEPQVAAPSIMATICMHTLTVIRAVTPERQVRFVSARQVHRSPVTSLHMDDGTHNVPNTVSHLTLICTCRKWPPPSTFLAVSKQMPAGCGCLINASLTLLSNPINVG